MAIGYLLRESISGFRRARLAVWATLMTMSMALLLVGLFALLAHDVRALVEGLKEKVELEVFLRDPPAKPIDVWARELRQNPAVEALVYVSKDSAAAIFRREFGSEAELFIAYDFLPASFRLRLRPAWANPDSAAALARRLSAMEGVDEVVYNQALLARLEENVRLLGWIGAGVGALVLLAAIALMVNTIRLKVYAKRLIIRTMKLVGATEWFIRIPFVLEGFMLGAMAGLLAGGVLFALREMLLVSYLPALRLLPWPGGHPAVLWGALALFGGLVGMSSASLTAKRFIRRTPLS
ncbi:MAG: permease-like cell division protein FtsX [Bacteroidetes bacterium]|nr:permease-like cell division protein FtsX [Rhodothermia bacterium]MCS7155452.1 permease-like cell division protein FtsX [Bacteroidota bacterium]MCX7907455.1 permease-like cell division protein FtsX [Bacteroidota bacterium]MDW8138449.1 permease-like cell division protein FtsX [Bacteroidota bacterium]MDW8284614.1 permease-like cell division protein FtsX [Bacteroidota bacterium]